MIKPRLMHRLDVMTFSLLLSNYCCNLPTDLLDYQLPHHQREPNTEHNPNQHISPLIWHKKDVSSQNEVSTVTLESLSEEINEGWKWLDVPVCWYVGCSNWQRKQEPKLVAAGMYCVLIAIEHLPLFAKSPTGVLILRSCPQKKYYSCGGKH